MRSARPPYAPTGIPPPMILPSVVRSGRTWSRSCAPPAETRKPVITSSKINRAPCRSHSARSAVWNSGSGAMRSEEHTSELQSQSNLVCRLLLEKKKKKKKAHLVYTRKDVNDAHNEIVIALQSAAR